ncbi:MAG: hypothetical protein J3R72DRAFT_245097 [Linnemannia gamsii]|nr:MAG: hypothetical protein J3R72DRAFT_245097 [Linnemannia gamsii]
MTRPARGGGIVDSYRDQEENDYHHASTNPSASSHMTTTAAGDYAYEEDEKHYHQQQQAGHGAEFTVYEDPEEPQPQPQLQQRHQQQQQQYRSTISSSRTTFQRGHQRIHQQQQQDQQQVMHPGDMSGVDLYEVEEAGAGGVSIDGIDNGGIEYCSDQEHVQPVRRTAGSSTAAAAAVSARIPMAPVARTMSGITATATAAPAMDARQELMQRSKHSSSAHLQQRRSSATLELLGRSRAPIQQQPQQQQQRVIASRQQAAAAAEGGSYKEVPGAPGRKRTRDGEAEAVYADDQVVSNGGAGGDGSEADLAQARENERRRHAKRQLLIREREQQELEQVKAQRAHAHVLAQAQAHAQAQAQAQVQPHAQVQAQAQDPALSQQQLVEKQQRDNALRKARKLQSEEMKQYNRLIEHIDYGQVYEDDTYEYRNVTLPKVLLRFLPREYMVHPNDKNSYLLRLLKESEWRHLGLRMSQFWVHYLCHAPEPHVLLFRRPVGTGERLKKEQDRKKEQERKEAARKNGSSSQQQPQQSRSTSASATTSESSSRSGAHVQQRHQQQSSSSSAAAVSGSSKRAEAESQDNGVHLSRESTPPRAPKRSNADKPRQ